jgi:hypothetical protein
MKNPLGIYGIPYPVVITLVIIVSIWQLFWKGLALWKSSQFKQRNWFVALFILIVLNDLGLLSLIYLFFFSKKKLTWIEIKSWFVKIKKS